MSIMKTKIVNLSEIRSRRIEFKELFTARERTLRSMRGLMSAIGVGVRKVKG